jgi:hypothetical protein
MSELLAVEAIQERYPNEWVLIGDLELEDQSLKPLRGRVLHHGVDRTDVYRKAVGMRSGRCMVYFTGEFSPAGDVWITPFLSSVLESGSGACRSSESEVERATS